MGTKQPILPLQMVAVPIWWTYYLTGTYKHQSIQEFAPGIPAEQTICKIAVPKHIDDHVLMALAILYEFIRAMDIQVGRVFRTTVKHTEYSVCLDVGGLYYPQSSKFDTHTESTVYPAPRDKDGGRIPVDDCLWQSYGHVWVDALIDQRDRTISKPDRAQIADRIWTDYISRQCSWRFPLVGGNDADVLHYIRHSHTDLEEIINEALLELIPVTSNSR